MLSSEVTLCRKVKKGKKIGRQSGRVQCNQRVDALVFEVFAQMAARRRVALGHAMDEALQLWCGIRVDTRTKTLEKTPELKDLI